MPNWVENTLHVNKDYLGYITDQYDHVNFNLAKPIPTELVDTEDGSNTDIDMYYYLSDRLNNPVDSIKKDPNAQEAFNNLNNGIALRFIDKDTLKPNESLIEKYITNLCETTTKCRQPNTDDASYERGRILINNFRNFKCITWYDWCNRNWGCKWNASESSLENDPNDNDYVYLRFMTPWSPPDSWCERLCELNIPFRLEWIEEQGYHGEIISDGKFLSCNDLPFVSDEDDDDDYDE